MQEILINSTPQETRVAVVESGSLQELQMERNADRGLVGNIYRGKARRVLPGMQAAFIDIGFDRNGFLHARDITRNDPAFSREQQKEQQIDTPPIDKLIHEGETVWVQVIKDPVAEKGARLTTELSVPSRYFVYMPNNPHIGISQKIEVAEDRERLLAMLNQLKQNCELEGGFIIRTVADTASNQQLTDDLLYLQKLWQKIKLVMQRETRIAVVYQDVPLATRILRDIVGEQTEKVYIDSPAVFKECVAYAEELNPKVLDKLRLYDNKKPLFTMHSVEEELQKALLHRVELESGGYLIFDQTEAMTTIDVNTGGFVGKRNQEETQFKTNIEAATAIAHQIKLRNLGGIIIIDFIDMTQLSHRKKVCEELATGVAKDRVKTRISGMSELGLVELTRKRTSNSLEKQLCEPCMACKGSGSIKTATTVCYEIFRALIREANRYKAANYTIVASPVVGELLIEEEASGLADIEELIGSSITLKVDKLYSQERYAIVFGD